MNLILLRQESIRQFLNKDIYKNLAIKELLFTLSMHHCFTDRSNYNDKLAFDTAHSISPIPIVNHNFNKTFAEINDQRANEVRILANQANKKLLIRWSGGIDSTMIMVSILRNFPKADLALIEVALNSSSIIENPHFYNQYVKDQFNIIDSSLLIYDQDLMSRYIVIDSEPADFLYGLAISPLYKQYHNGVCGLDLHKNKDVVIDLLLNKMYVYEKRSEAIDITDQDRLNFALRYYDLVCGSAYSHNRPLKTIGDFWWWRSFNWFFQHNIFKPYLDFSSKFDQDNFNQWKASYLPWCLTNDFQQWSMTNGYGVKFKDSITEHKLEARKYIHSFFKDSWYSSFKTKQLSINYQVFDAAWKTLALYDDGSIITVDSLNAKSFVDNLLTII